MTFTQPHRPLPEIVGGIRSVRDYFERFLPEDPLFVPELQRADEILAVIDTGSTSADTVATVMAIMSRPMPPHHGGTGWERVVSLVEEWGEALAEGSDPIHHPAQR